jgi:hypothetical protein
VRLLQHASGAAPGNGTTAGTGRSQERLVSMDKERIVAVGLLTRRDLNLLGPTFTRAWPVDDAPCFADLLRAIDEAERETGKPAPSDRRS